MMGGEQHHASVAVAGRCGCPPGVPPAVWLQLQVKGEKPEGIVQNESRWLIKGGEAVYGLFV